PRAGGRRAAGGRGGAGGGGRGAPTAGGGGAGAVPGARNVPAGPVSERSQYQRSHARTNTSIAPVRRGRRSSRCPLHKRARASTLQPITRVWRGEPPARGRGGEATPPGRPEGPPTRVP